MQRDSKHRYQGNRIIVLEELLLDIQMKNGGLLQVAQGYTATL